MKRSPWILLLVAGCSSPPPAAPVIRGEPPKQECQIVVQAESAEWQKAAEELTKGRSVGEQQKLLESERHYQLALSWFNKGDFDKAKEQAQIAVEKWPEHIAARKLFSDVGEIIVGGPTRLRGIGDHDLRVAQVTVEQQQLEITNHILHGGRFLDAKMYRSALRELENAEFKIRNMPYDVKSMNDLLPKVREMAARAKSSIRD
ncbi:MAG: hypothetical protein HY293_14890 [Planctomycetes bacterium]|nr:hypothetical protein [Planctomycetota bacterium]